ncbi:MAG: radical SAM protein [Elusimicrobia bacterium]|nr:radical SAM protein [Elusimicrobiota bacterium]
MKALLVLLKQQHKFYWNVSESEYRLQRYQPLGLLYVSSSLEKHGVKTEFLDQSIDNLSSLDLKNKISANKYDFVGFYSDSTLKNIVCQYIKDIKSSLNVTVIVGGPGVLNNKEFFDAGCDIVCNGEGEVTICEIVDYLKGEKHIENIKGISFSKNGKTTRNEDRELIENLDILPFPDRDKTQADKYYDFHKFTMRTPFTTLITSRGCSYNCSYCTSHVFWKRKVRLRSPENIIKEIDTILEKNNIKYFYFLDENFGLNMKWLFEFCQLLIDKKYNFHWCCAINPFSYRGKKEEAFSIMKKAGCDHVILGLQSAHPEILKNCNRSPEQPEEAAKTIRIAKKLGMLVQLEMIFGLPGDTEETIKKSIDYTILNNPHITGFFALTILEGSEIEQKYKDKKVCELSKKRIDELCSLASKKFYVRPKKIFELFFFIIINNARWLTKAIQCLPFIFSIAGLKRRATK